MAEPLERAADLVERVGRPNRTRGAGTDAISARHGVTLHNQALEAILEHAQALEARVHALERWIEVHVSPTSVPTIR